MFDSRSAALSKSVLRETRQRNSAGLAGEMVESCGAARFSAVTVKYNYNKNSGFYLKDVQGHRTQKDKHLLFSLISVA